MVSVTHAIAPGDTAAPIDLLAAGLTVDERRRVESAVDWIVELYAGQVLGTGESAWTHAIGTALIAASLRLVADTRIAALLFAAWEALDDPVLTIEARFGADVSRLVRGLQRLHFPAADLGERWRCVERRRSRRDTAGYQR